MSIPEKDFLVIQDCEANTCDEPEIQSRLSQNRQLATFPYMTTSTSSMICPTWRHSNLIGGVIMEICHSHDHQEFGKVGIYNSARDSDTEHLSWYDHDIKASRQFWWGIPETSGTDGTAYHLYLAPIRGRTDNEPTDSLDPQLDRLAWHQYRSSRYS